MGGTSRPSKHHGNTVLVKIGHSDYICITRDILSFKPLEEVLCFYSPWDPSVQPYAITKNYTYLIFEEKGKSNYIENKYLKYIKKGDFVYDVLFDRDGIYEHLKDKFKKYDLPILKKGPW